MIKDAGMQSVMLFNHQARNQGQHGNVNQEVRQQVNQVIQKDY